MDLVALDEDFGQIVALLDEEPPAPAPPPQTVRWEKGSASLMMYVRECRARHLVERRLEACQEKLATLTARLDWLGHFLLQSLEVRGRAYLSERPRG